MVTSLTADQILDRIASPAMYPQAYDPTRARVLMLHMSEADYRAASFLDDRILSAHSMGGWAPFDKVAEVARALSNAKPIHYIFHIGHVGSTLLSRLLDEMDGVLSLREPLPLRTLAGVPESAAVETFLRLWGRGFDTTRTVVLKATSSAARVAPQLLSMRPQSFAIYMYLQPEPYLATLLAGENSPADLRAHEEERRNRLAAQFGAPLPPVNSPGERAAMSWLAERLTMNAVVDAFRLRVMPLDFDAFLSDLEVMIARVATHLGLHADTKRIATIARSPTLMRYSKAPEHEYSPAFRAEILAQSRRDNAAEIVKGMTWLKASGINV